MHRINTNAQKSAFWLLAHVLSQPSLAAAICKEVAGAISYPRTDPTTSSETIIDYQYLLESCPHLNSVFYEILRVTSTSANVREVLTPVQLGGKTIPKGAKVFIPHRQLLLDEEGFGPTANQMDPDRFLNDKSLERNGFYRPFGGGSTLCSGRFIARREVLAFVAIVFSRYDIRVVKQGEEVMGVKGKAFPRLDEGKPSLGISMQVPGDDVILHVVERSI
jgi:cytochrome P450